MSQPQYPRRSPEVSRICRESWDDTQKKLDPCHKCPLIPACHRVTNPGLDNYLKYISALNQLAEEVEL